MLEPTRRRPVTSAAHGLLIGRLLLLLTVTGLVAAMFAGGASEAHATTTTAVASHYGYDHPARFAQCAIGCPCRRTVSAVSKDVRLQQQFASFQAVERALVAAEEGLSWAEQSGILRSAARGKGNFGIGSATSQDADVLGRAWVGEDYTVASDGRTLISKNGLRQYRPPSYKPDLGRYQANFEQRFEGQQTRRWQSNGHLDITNVP
jgi:hypothetical protein